jgi:UDP-glucose 4-epimerase
MEEKNITLVTGGAGFIGSHLCEYLEKSGDNVYVIDNNYYLNYYQNNKLNKNKNINYVFDNCIGYIESFLRLPEKEKKNHWLSKVKTIYHLAATSRIKESFNNPIECTRNNVVATTAICELAKYNNSNIVYTDTSSSLTGSKSPYTKTKTFGKEICRLYSDLYNLHTRVAVLYNVYGPGQTHEGNLANSIGIFEYQFKNNLPITVTGDGSQRRNFVHVKDVCEALALLGKNNLESNNKFIKYEIGYSIPFEYFKNIKNVLSVHDCKQTQEFIQNLADHMIESGISHSMLEIASMFKRKSEEKANISFIEQIDGEPPIRNVGPIVHNEKMYLDYGWLPKIYIKDYIRDFCESIEKETSLINEP